MKPPRALSIRQPYAEQILRGKKKQENRSRPTRVRGRVYIYASMGRTPTAAWTEFGKSPGSLPTGVIVGSVEVVDCEKRRGGYAWILRSPRPIRRPVKPGSHPQPVWFFPFGKSR